VKTLPSAKRQCFLQVSGNSLQQVETFKYLGVVFTSGESRNKGIDTRKQTQFYKSSIALWWRNGNFQTPQSFPFLNRILFRSTPVVINLRWRLKEYYQKSRWQRSDICEEISVWHFVTKSTGLKSVKPGTSSHFSELRDPSYVCSAMYPECLRKEWRTKPSGCSLHPRESRPEFDQGAGGVTTSPTLLGPVMAWSQQNYLRLLLILRCFESS